jgi:DnaK suppressor protein
VAEAAKQVAGSVAKVAKKAVKKTTPARDAGTAVATRPTRSSSRSASPRTAVSALVVKEGEGAWTKAEIKEVLSELHEDRDRAVRTLSGQEAELDKLMRDAGDGAGHDQADMGATSFERDQEIIVVQNEREKLAQIDRALARIADGTYGLCESCGNPIGKMRAMAFPRATLCMTCKQREERR